MCPKTNWKINGNNFKLFFECSAFFNHKRLCLTPQNECKELAVQICLTLLLKYESESIGTDAPHQFDPCWDDPVFGQNVEIFCKKLGDALKWTQTGKEVHHLATNNLYRREHQNRFWQNIRAAFVHPKAIYGWREERFQYLNGLLCCPFNFYSHKFIQIIQIFRIEASMHQKTKDYRCGAGCKRLNGKYEQNEFRIIFPNSLAQLVCLHQKSKWFVIFTWKFEYSKIDKMYRNFDDIILMFSEWKNIFFRKNGIYCSLHAL